MSRRLSDRDYAVDRLIDSIIANVDTARDVVDLLAALWGVRFDQDGNIAEEHWGVRFDQDNIAEEQVWICEFGGTIVVPPDSGGDCKGCNGRQELRGCGYRRLLPVREEER